MTRLGHVWDRVLSKFLNAPVSLRRVALSIGMLGPLLLLYRDLIFLSRPWLDLDLLLSYQPRYALLAEGLHAGHIPLWTDGMLAGFPIAFSEFGWFYPLTWALLRAFDPLRAYTIELAIGLALAAGAAYWLGRVWGLTRLGAYLASFLFTYGAFVFATSRFLNYADIYFALPAGIGTIELITRGHRKYVGILGLSAAVMALAGHPQIALLFGFSWGLFAVFRLWCACRDRGPQHTIASLAWITTAVSIGLAIGAVRLIPTMLNTGLSMRADGLGFAIAAQGSIPPWSLALGYLFPSFEIPRLLGDTLNAEELLYLGMATPALALMALCSRSRDKVVWFLCGLVVVSWIFAMGSFSLGFPLLHKLPLFGFFRQPARFGIVASFGLAYLAAIGIDQICSVSLRTSTPVRWITQAWVRLAGLIGAGTVTATVVLSGFAFLIIPYAHDYIDREIVGSEGRFLTAERYYRTFDQLYERMTMAFSLEFWTPRWTLCAAALTALIFWAWIRRRLPARNTQVALLVVLVLDVMVAPGHTIPTVPSDWHARNQHAVTVFPTESSGEWRIFSYRGLAQKFELSTAVGTTLNRSHRDLLEYLFLNETVSPNLPLTIQHASIDGYENLMSRAAAEYLAYIGSERSTIDGFASDASLDAVERSNLLHNRLSLLAAANVRYITSGVELEDSLLLNLRSGPIDLPSWSPVEQNLFVYELHNWAPRAWITRNWQTIDHTMTPNAVLDAMASQADPDMVLVNRDPGIVATTPTEPDIVHKADRGPRHVTLRIVSSTPGLLVFNEAMYPGWTVTVDQKPTDLLTVNTIMRGIPIDRAGPHTVVMSYNPPGFGLGLTLTVGGLIALLLLSTASWRSDRT